LRLARGAGGMEGLLRVLGSGESGEGIWVAVLFALGSC
jgi:hypothetical protein